MHQLFFFQKNIFFKPKMTGVSCIFQFCFFSKIIFQKLISAPLPPIKRVNLLKSIKPSSELKSPPHKNIHLTLAQHFPALSRTLSCIYKNILLTAAQDFMAKYAHNNDLEEEYIDLIPILRSPMYDKWQEYSKTSFYIGK